ncbi:MAG: Glutamate-tRNA ligase [Parcubacteria group bacterium GW2011_GWC2_45_7]|nr:MAG: Glutamate-tRNA ligase [Parcubacteria group bacterium GW2011_GWA2_42_28]KKU12589.1 MAG: Glutamate-tRNA ligase [Parcubacteria group bacterium GW2011_GWC2_45_7]
MPRLKTAQKIRVRFAPSPTGFLHIGSLRTALYNYLFAKKHSGDFILRIEDTDRTRYVEGGVENIIKTLEWCGLNYNEGPRLNSAEVGEYGPYIQSKRLEIYKKYVEALVKKGKAYYCVCTPERLENLREQQMAAKLPTIYDGFCRDKKTTQEKPVGQHVIRLKVPKIGKTKFEDLIHGQVEFANKLIDDQVLLKSDGYPTYHLANIIDDNLMEITHVIRGDEWLPSTPKHILLYEAFDWKAPQFTHLPLLLNPDHSKLSKRQGDVAVEDYIKKGYLPEAIINFVALLGFNPRSDKELYTLDELIADFDLVKVNKSGAVVNFEKLDWMNGHYIRTKTLDELTQLCVPFLINAGWPEEIRNPKLEIQNRIKKIVALEQERIKKLADIVDAAEIFRIDQPHYEPKILVWKKAPKEGVRLHLTALFAFLTGYKGDWTAQNLEQTIKAWVAKEGRGVGEVLWPFRVALAGRLASPPPFDIAAILGKAQTLKRLEYAIELAKKL